ncbi:MAG: gamma-glutamylcyclotransferase [Azonexus sp.]|jgi:hypothetical protein|nr:gamma-glutamylcyclotransferase [Azonexus sp.]
MKLFVYGSLLNPDSAGRALKRRPGPEQLTPVTLPGYRLIWNSISRIHSATAGEIDASFLNLAAAPGVSAPGCLLDIDADELARLCQREKGYVAREIDCLTATGEVVAALAFIDERPPPSRLPPVLAAYLAKIEAGLALLPPDFAVAWRAALPPPQALIDGDYYFVDGAQRDNT